jgi:hypothetical protein
MVRNVSTVRNPGHAGEIRINCLFTFDEPRGGVGDEMSRMPSMRPIVVVSVCLTIAAAALFTFAAELAARNRPVWYMSLDRDMAVLTGAIAAMCWLELRRERRDEDRRREEGEHRRREEALIRVISSQLADDPTGPLQKLRAL